MKSSDCSKRRGRTFFLLAMRKKAPPRIATRAFFLVKQKSAKDVACEGNRTRDVYKTFFGILLERLTGRVGSGAGWATQETCVKDPASNLLRLSDQRRGPGVLRNPPFAKRFIFASDTFFQLGLFSSLGKDDVVSLWPSLMLRVLFVLFSRNIFIQQREHRAFQSNQSNQ